MSWTLICLYGNMVVYETCAVQTSENMQIEIMEDGIPENAPIQFTATIRPSNLDKKSHRVVVY